jgi:hypothetical protein
MVVESPGGPHGSSPLLVPPQVAERFARALAAAVHDHDRTTRELREAARACARELKDWGLPPERMLIAMKALVRSTAASHPPPHGHRGSERAADEIASDIMTWCIEEYYRTG